GIRDFHVTGVQTCALPICRGAAKAHRRRPRHLLYHAYEMHRTLLAGASDMATISARMLSNPALPLGYFGMGPFLASALEVFAHRSEERRAGGEHWREC